MTLNFVGLFKVELHRCFLDFFFFFNQKRKKCERKQHRENLSDAVILSETYVDVICVYGDLMGENTLCVVNVIMVESRCD